MENSPAQRPKEPVLPLSEDFVLDALSQDFAGPQPLHLSFEDAKLQLPSLKWFPKPQLHHPLCRSTPDTVQSDDKNLTMPWISFDSLGQRQPDPDENKPIEDKVKEKAEAEHRDKLGERDDTIPPEYRHLG